MKVFLVGVNRVFISSDVKILSVWGGCWRNDGCCCTWSREGCWGGSWPSRAAFMFRSKNRPRMGPCNCVWMPQQWVSGGKLGAGIQGTLRTGTDTGSLSASLATAWRDVQWPSVQQELWHRLREKHLPEPMHKFYKIVLSLYLKVWSTVVPFICWRLLLRLWKMIMLVIPGVGIVCYMCLGRGKGRA